MGSTRRQILDDQLHAHFVTFSCYKRRRLLTLDQPKRMVLGALNQELERVAAQCVGFAIMPDHVHAIVWFPEPGRLSRFMHEWKRYSSRIIREWYQEHKMRYFEEAEFGIRFWQAKYYAFPIDNERKLEEELDYMHQNPVRAGLVVRAIDWPWSSARWYTEQRNVGVPIAWVG